MYSSDDDCKAGYPKLEKFDVLTDDFPYLASYDKDENSFTFFKRLDGSSYVVQEMSPEELQSVDFSKYLKDNCVLADITGDARLSLWIPNQNLHRDFSPDGVLETVRYNLFRLSDGYVKFVGERGVLSFYKNMNGKIEYTSVYYPANMQKDYEAFKATILEYLNIQKAFTPTLGSDGYRENRGNTVLTRFSRSKKNIQISVENDGTFQFYASNFVPDETNEAKQKFVKTLIEFEEVQRYLNQGFSLQKTEDGRLKLSVI